MADPIASELRIVYGVTEAQPQGGYCAKVAWRRDRELGIVLGELRSTREEADQDIIPIEAAILLMGPPPLEV